MFRSVKVFRTLIKNLFFFVYMDVCLCMYTSAYRGQKKELRSQRAGVAGFYGLTWMLGLKLCSSARPARALNH